MAEEALVGLKQSLHFAFKNPPRPQRIEKHNKTRDILASARIFINAKVRKGEGEVSQIWTRSRLRVVSDEFQAQRNITKPRLADC